MLENWKSPNQSRAPGEENGKDNIGHGRGDPDHLAARFDALHVFDVGRAFSNTFMKNSCNGGNVTYTKIPFIFN